MAALEVVSLEKSYGTLQALRGVSLSIGQGEVYGLLGQNGAGKSTLVKILLSIVRATRGSARLLGLEVPSAASRERVGFLPEDHRFPEYHTGRSALDFYGALSGMGREDRRRRSAELLERLGISKEADRKIRTYSKGMKQRLGLAQAILHDPELVFLDEPTDGVDVLGRVQVRDLLLELKGRGRTIFLNSHLLSEVERVCDRVGILKEGRLVAEGTVESLTRAENVTEIRVEGPLDAAWPELLALEPGARRAGDAVEVLLADPKALDPLIDLLRSKGVGVRGVTGKRRSLEDVFREAVQEPPAP
jgi:ABC-2 type transport system ATP-binding protein